ncbi:MAG: phage shock protein operon transcriptional activator, partial [Pseudomonadota bacterium]|nr:phage shock protein operon transcriptional activator [Pseudomonadota bacterium]
HFRADLLDRLSFEVVTLPPLRARTGDVMVLAEHFGRRMASEMGQDWVGFSKASAAALVAYDWPGNVRELRNVVERAVYRWEQSGPIDAVEFDPFQSPHGPAAAGIAPAPQGEAPMVSAATQAKAIVTDDFKASVAAFECALLEAALAEHRFNQRTTAAALGLSYDQLRHALRKHSLLGESAPDPLA